MCCKAAQCIIPRPHDDNPVAGPRQFGNAVAAVFSGRDIFGVSACCGDRIGDVLAADAFVHSAAEIDGVAQDQVVVFAQHIREYGGEFSAHVADRAVAVGLEESDDPARKGFECREGCSDLVGVVAEIVDDGDAICGPDNVEAAGEAVEALHAAHRLRYAHAKRDARGNCGERVGDIVAAGDD